MSTLILHHPNGLARITIIDRDGKDGIGPIRIYQNEKADLVVRAGTGDDTKIARIDPNSDGENGNPILDRLNRTTESGASGATERAMTAAEIDEWSLMRGMRPTHVLVDCGQTHDPEDPDADDYITPGFPGEPRDVAIRHHKQWLTGKLIGPPFSNYERTYPVEQMREQRLVSVWMWIPLHQYPDWHDMATRFDKERETEGNIGKRLNALPGVNNLIYCPDTADQPVTVS